MSFCGSLGQNSHIRSRMPVLTDEEVNTVRESCRQLGAIGRNLNQVARALNIEFRESDKLKQEAIEKLAERIDQHLDHVSELFDKTWSRWHDCHFQKTTAPVDWA
ncbi:plasmid mobilization relaxosome protein MobC, partial [Klebsiella pneumoniae]|uniref:plasmid mobilization relaxosome protein MobC n=1 Tax=Klebsiella pneumoniae TaxID=573 RepID=UPI003438BB89